MFARRTVSILVGLVLMLALPALASAPAAAAPKKHSCGSYAAILEAVSTKIRTRGVKCGQAKKIIRKSGKKRMRTGQARVRVGKFRCVWKSKNPATGVVYKVKCRHAKGKKWVKYDVPPAG